MAKKNIKFLFTSISDNIGISYTCLTLAKHMTYCHPHISLTTPRVKRLATDFPFPILTPVPKPVAAILPYRYFGIHLARYTEHKFTDYCNRGDAAYVWSNVSIECIRRLKKKGVTIFREKFSCHNAFVKATYDREYNNLGLKPDHGVTQFRIDEEKIILDEVDFVFRASPGQEKTLLDNGVAPEKIIPSSYGWDPHRFDDSVPTLPPVSGKTFIFVGRGVVGKGVHLLIESWVKAGTDDRLVFVGGLAQAIRDRYKEHLTGNNILCFDYTDRIGDFYASADVFIFPTLAEGSPLVMYEAIGNSLAVISSPMGAGAIVRDNIEGLVLEPHDQNSWVDAIRRISNDSELLNGFKTKSRQRANKFTWDIVAKQRLDAILERMT